MSPATLRQLASAVVDNDGLISADLADAIVAEADVDALAEFDRFLEFPPQRRARDACVEMIRRHPVRLVRRAWWFLSRWGIPKEAWMLEKLQSEEEETPGPNPAPPSFSREVVLGKGGMGTVYPAGEDRAVKVVLDADQLVVRERNALMMLRHEGLVRGFSACLRDNVAYMEMELAPYGSFQSYSTQPPECFGMVARQLMAAVDYLDSLELMHGDVCARNVLVFGPRLIKLCDFGNMQKYESVRGGAWYDFDEPPNDDYPPEMYGKTPPDDLRKVDWWGVGRVLYGLCKGDWRASPQTSEEEDPKSRAATRMMRLKAEDRCAEEVRAFPEETAFLYCHRFEGKREQKGKPEEDGGGKRKRMTRLNERAFAYVEGCPDSELAGNRELLIRKM